MAENTDLNEVEQGDYIVGESAVYEIAAVKGAECKIRAACETVEYDNAAEKNSGWQDPAFVKSLGSHLPREDVESITITDGDTLVWHSGNEDGSAASAVVNIEDDGGVVIESDGLFVPESFADELALKCNIALGYANQ